MGSFNIIRITIASVLPYILFMKTYDEFINDWLERLIHHNILCVKIFQALSGNTPTGYFSKTVMKIFEKQTNNTSFDESDIDRGLVNRVVESYDLTLDSQTPCRSGMVGLVFFAHGKCCCECSSDTDQCTNKLCNSHRRYVLKTKRCNIYSRIKTGHAEFIKIYYTILRFSSFFPKIRQGLESLRSLVDTRDYILTQCDFGEEIAATICCKNEMTDSIDTLVIPTVYNDPNKEHSIDKNEYILLEYLDGHSIFDIDNVRDKETVFSTLAKTVGFAVFSNESTYLHSDLHPGNIICVPRTDGNGINIGMIDFGMNTKIDDDMRKLTIGMYGSVAKHIRHPDKFVDIMMNAKNFVVPNFTTEELNSIPTELYQNLNNVFLSTMVGLVDGDLDENKMHDAIRYMNTCMDDGINRILSPNTFKLLMSQSMCISTANICVTDLKIRSRLQKEAMRWASTEL